MKLQRKITCNSFLFEEKIRQKKKKLQPIKKNKFATSKKLKTLVPRAFNPTLDLQLTLQTTFKMARAVRYSSLIRLVLQSCYNRFCNAVSSNSSRLFCIYYVVNLVLITLIYGQNNHIFSCALHQSPPLLQYLATSLNGCY